MLKNPLHAPHIAPAATSAALVLVFVLGLGLVLVNVVLIVRSVLVRVRRQHD
ncbi:hypothetical protein [Paraburkholderia piptadeniae]|uniref:hypothetical protein n=1 Tax=Paraburkholderia piptadeniae TaxID=1701573 RepID=UPI00139673A6|nr:hypothetical protein [Paraburkholderia piptadeniae]